MPVKKLTRLLTIMSVKDGFCVTLFFLITVLAFNNTNILENYWQLAVFALLGLAFSALDEKISIKRQRWEYSTKMPKILGVGLTPLLEIAVTGVLTFVLIF